MRWLGQIPKHWEAKRLRFVVSEPLKYGGIESAELDDPDLDIIAYLDGMWNRLNALMGKLGTSIEQLREYGSALISAAVIGEMDVRGEVRDG